MFFMLCLVINTFLAFKKAIILYAKCIKVVKYKVLQENNNLNNYGFTELCLKKLPV